MTLTPLLPIRNDVPALVIFLASAVSAGPAIALTHGQSNAVENVAQAIAGTQVCSAYRPNVGMLTVLSIRFGFRFDDPAIKSALEERTIFHAARIKGRTPADICAALERLFGPDGSNVKGLVVKN